jgi:gas vesicle structural protein
MPASTHAPNRYLERPAPSSLADVIDVILDKGLVIDVYIRVSLVGIELLTIDARIVIASVDTYLRFAEAVNRLDLTETEVSGIPELVQDMTESGAKGKTSGAIEAAKEKFEDLVSGDEDEEAKQKTRRKSDDEGGGSTRSRRSSGTRRSRESK